MPATLPETFGRYRIVKKLGEGGMGAVYLAHDTEMDRPVALKVPQFDKREQAAVIEQFKREARIAARIRHPGICTIHDVGCIDGIHYLTMAYIEGRELADVLADGQPWPPARAIELVIRIAEALHELHTHGIATSSPVTSCSSPIINRCCSTLGWHAPWWHRVSRWQRRVPGKGRPRTWPRSSGRHRSSRSSRGPMCMRWG